MRTGSRTGGDRADSPPAWSCVPYKRTKLAAEQVVLDAARAGFDAVVVNPTTPVGEGDMKSTRRGRMIAGVASGSIRGYVATTGLNVVDAHVARGHALALERGSAASGTCSEASTCLSPSCSGPSPTSPDAPRPRSVSRTRRPSRPLWIGLANRDE